ncbi:ABC transporter C family member 10 [Platanthera zijinensis]|uniref:ABC transporter C family member 10 n=1 Tax=Platanthera zijinensis TaxID=2320716 RepID=A0AAP0B0D0_9ASPA
MAFCGGSVCSSYHGEPCGLEIFLHSTCMNHILVISTTMLLFVAFVSNFVRKLSSKKILLQTLFQFSTPLQLFSIIFNGLMGFAYLSIGAWMLKEKLGRRGLFPLHLWLVLFSQGFSWVLISLVASIRAKQLGDAFVKVWAGVASVLAVFLCISSGLGILVQRVMSIRIVLDLLALPGALLLLLCAFRSQEDNETAGGSLYEPLSSDSYTQPISSDVFVTSFANAGFLSRMSFWWLNSLMKKGCEKPLDDKDIPHMGEMNRAESCYFMFLEQLSRQTQSSQTTSPSFFRAIVSCHKREILFSGLFALLKVLTLSAGPMLLNAFIKVSVGMGTFKYEGYVLALGMFFVKVLESLSQRQWHFRTRTLGLQIRSLLSAAVYQKQLRLSSSAKLIHSSGEIMNYVTVDAYRIGEFPVWFHQTWTTCLQLCIALVILYHAVGLATISSMVVIVLTVLCNAPVAKLQHKFQTKLMEAQDERLKAMSEALVNMKVLKLYAWETHFRKVIEDLREEECKWLSAFQLQRAYNSFVFWSSPVVVSAATFLTCYLMEIPLYPSNVFTFVATLRLVQDPVRSIPDVIGAFIQAKVAFGRIVKFLDSEELQNENVRKSCNITVEHPIMINSASFSWDDNASKLTLRNINIELKHGEKIAICGEVGSGKSTLLAAILGEIPIIEGSGSLGAPVKVSPCDLEVMGSSPGSSLLQKCRIQVTGKIAYVSQNAWIQTGTVQENILFGSTLNNQKYQVALEKCSLVKDLVMLPFGDLTVVGERGVNLSGGQKQRVQLARALYKDAEIYLLDDPFSAVDAHTATSLFNDYVIGALSSKTVLLVTHQVDFLPAFDSILLMSEGEVLRSAPYHELMVSSKEFQDLVNAHKDTADPESCEKITLHKRCMLVREIHDTCLNNQQKTTKSSGDDQLIKREEKEIGDTGLKPYLQYLNQNKGFLYSSLAAASHIIFISGQISQNSWMAANVQNPEVSTLRLITVYLAIGCSTAIFLLSRSVFVVILGLQSSKSLFSQLLNSLFRAPMSFFDSTPLGRILSRVSSDLSIVDLDVPFSLIFSISATLNAYSNLGILAVLTWQAYYLASAKELMRVNGTTKSLVANHLAESVSGAVTIRAFQEEDRFFAKNLELIDSNASPFFHNFAASEWLIQRLETMGAAVLSTSALVMALLPPGTFSSGYVGMALSYGFSLNMSLVFSIQNQCTLANYIISVERLNQYMSISSEAPEVVGGNRPPPNWPAIGKVELRDLKIRYRLDTPLVLQGISCTFEGGHKIGIVGRTGSGKTTLIGALFRLVEPSGGKIIIDGLNISTIGLHDLRSRFGIIPQDPTLFHGSVRYNLDPLGQHSDLEIWEVKFSAAFDLSSLPLRNLPTGVTSNLPTGVTHFFSVMIKS